MPRMNGFELLSYFRQHRALAGIPVVVLSSSAQPGDRAQAKALGATDYLVKPSSVEDYLDMATSLIRYMA